jgi:hypothetical protein
MSLDRINSSLVFLKGVSGLLALIAALALTSPGVRIARAADGLVSAPPADMSVDPALVRALALANTGANVPSESKTPESGPSCDGPRMPSVLNSPLAEQQTRRIQRELARRAGAAKPSAESPEADVVVLNGRGYNYRPAPIR